MVGKRESGEGMAEKTRRSIMTSSGQSIAAAASVKKEKDKEEKGRESFGNHGCQQRGLCAQHVR